MRRRSGARSPTGLRLALLSPAVINAMLAGRLKPGIDSTALIATGAIPLDWGEQGRRFVAVF